MIGMVRPVSLRQIRADISYMKDRVALEETNIQAIEHLSDEETADFLHLKWIVPVSEGIHGALTAVLSALEAEANQGGMFGQDVCIINTIIWTIITTTYKTSKSTSARVNLHDTNVERHGVWLSDCNKWTD